MVSDNYNRNIIIRIILIALNALLISWLLGKENWLYTLILMIILFVIQVGALIYYLQGIQRILSSFIDHIREQNTTLVPDGKSSVISKGLVEQFNSITQEMLNLQKEIVERRELTNLLIDNVKTGLIIMDSRGKLKLSNRYVLNLFDLPGNSTDKKLREFVDSNIPELSMLETGKQKVYNIANKRILTGRADVMMESEKLSIFSFQDINREMSENELQSWTGLIKVLTHEIMNGLTPMSTLIETLMDCTITEKGQPKTKASITGKDLEDIQKSLFLMKEKNSKLKNFIRKFSTISDIPEPEKEIINLSVLIEETARILLKKYKTIHLDLTELEKNIKIEADKDLLDLVIQNIIKNAVFALTNKKKPQINIASKQINNNLVVDIENNGEPISAKNLNKIFLPFFTTKEEGSGIGLSLARNIMYRHNGDIVVMSHSGKTTFRLMFQN